MILLLRALPPALPGSGSSRGEAIVLRLAAVAEARIAIPAATHTHVTEPIIAILAYNAGAVGSATGA